MPTVTMMRRCCKWLVIGFRQCTSDGLLIGVRTVGICSAELLFHRRSCLETQSSFARNVVLPIGRFVENGWSSKKIEYFLSLWTVASILFITVSCLALGEGLVEAICIAFGLCLPMWAYKIWQVDASVKRTLSGKQNI